MLAGKFGDLFGRKRIFQISVLIFIVGSFFCGLADDMTTLIIFRAVQGIGGGGLAVTATALIGEVIPLRERGKYQGALGAVFGVTTVHRAAARRPVHRPPVLALGVLRQRADRDHRDHHGRPDHSRESRHRASRRSTTWACCSSSLGASGLILATSWGGTQYPWGSATIIGLFGRLADRRWPSSSSSRTRAEEPILPMRLFRGRVFTMASILSFIVGFAMMGSITFLPTFLQFVSGASATSSGSAHAADGDRAAADRHRQRHHRRPDRQVPDVPDRRRRRSPRSGCTCCR